MKKYFPLITSFLFLTTGCAMLEQLSSKKPLPPSLIYEKVEYTLVETPSISKNPSLFLGGMSGLHFIGLNPKTSAQQFYTLTDRGPNAWTVDIEGLGKSLRPFPLPEFNPQILKIENQPGTNAFKIVGQIPLRDPSGKPLTGLPNLESKDEKPIDLAGKPLKYDLMGIDSEGIAVDDQGNIWICEEYRPSILKFDSKGRLLKRYVPKNSFSADQLRALKTKYKKDVMVDSLPEVLSERKLNRGFEGITVANNKVYAVLQSPLPIKGRQNELSIRMIELDPKSEKVTGQAVYPLTDSSVDKMGDLTFDKKTKRFFAIEQSGEVGDKGVHNIYSFEFVSASTDPTYLPELLTSEELQKVALKKRLELDMVKAGYKNFEKVEGLAILGNNKFAVVNDDDFQISGEPDMKNKTLKMDYNRPTVLAIIEVKEPPSQ